MPPDAMFDESLAAIGLQGQGTGHQQAEGDQGDADPPVQASGFAILHGGSGGGSNPTHISDSRRRRPCAAACAPNLDLSRDEARTYASATGRSPEFLLPRQPAPAADGRPPWDSLASIAPVDVGWSAITVPVGRPGQPASS